MHVNLFMILKIRPVVCPSWFFTSKALHYLLGTLGRPFDLSPGRIYDISKTMHWLMTRQPGGFRKCSHISFPEIERPYAEDLERGNHSDYLVGTVP